MTAMNPVVHFLMPYETEERIVTFYYQVFDWQIQHPGRKWLIMW